MGAGAVEGPAPAAAMEVLSVLLRLGLPCLAALPPGLCQDALLSAQGGTKMPEAQESPQAAFLWGKVLAQHAFGALEMHIL